MNSYEELNPMQQEAVLTTEGPVLVLAGAGSGKTRALTHRIAYLIEEKGVNPWHILAITFTNKAAGEMRDRVDRLVSFGAESVWVSTFHSACARILRRHIEELGYTPNFTIYDSDDQKTLMRQVLKKLDVDLKQYREKPMLGRISAAKNELVSVDEFAAKASGKYREMRIAEIYRTYQDELQKNNALDFDDLLVKTVELLQNNREIRERYQERFRYIMVDEYQDTNRAQFELVRLLAGEYRNLCVVGDDDQSIYRFRGADIRNILDFEQEFPGAKVIKLEQNYRSTQNILDAANDIIQNNGGRKKKQLWTSREAGKKIMARSFDSGFDEADAVAREVMNAVSSGLSYRDCAVLYRTNAQSRLLEECFVRRSIPYRLVGGVNFYQRREIKDVLAYLKTIDSGLDDLAVQRIINVPRRGIGAASIFKIMDFSDNNGLSFYEGLKRACFIPNLGKTLKKIEEFTELIEHLRTLAENLTVQELIYEILEQTGYREDLESEGDVESQTRMENIEELINKAAEFSRRPAMSTPDRIEQTWGGLGSLDEANVSAGTMLGSFLEEIALVADVDRMDPDEDCTVLMTLHSAKGLEFPKVIISGMEEGLFPGRRAIDSEDPMDLEEERRLAYVGITRAKDELTFTWARKRMNKGEIHFNRQSRFLDEISPSLFEDTQRKLLFMDNFRARNLKHGEPQGQKSSYTPEGIPDVSFGKNIPGASFGKQFTVHKAKSLNYGPGDRVKHRKFGDGTVESVEDKPTDYEVTVIFDRVGRKKMYASFANMEKLNSTT